jgi:hypothetical protein
VNYKFNYAHFLGLYNEGDGDADDASLTSLVVDTSAPSRIQDAAANSPFSFCWPSILTSRQSLRVKQNNNKNNELRGDDADADAVTAFDADRGAVVKKRPRRSRLTWGLAGAGNGDGDGDPRVHPIQGDSTNGGRGEGEGRRTDFDSSFGGVKEDKRSTSRIVRPTTDPLLTAIGASIISARNKWIQRVSQGGSVSDRDSASQSSAGSPGPSSPTVLNRVIAAVSSGRGRSFNSEPRPRSRSGSPMGSVSASRSRSWSGSRSPSQSQSGYRSWSRSRSRSRSSSGGWASTGDPEEHGPCCFCGCRKYKPKL